MSFQSLLIHTVIVYNRTDGTADRYGNPTDAFDSGTTVSGRVEPTDSNEFENDRDTRVSRFRIFLLPSVVISATSEVVYGAERYRVEGEPRAFADGAGPHHIEAVLERIDAG